MALRTLRIVFIFLLILGVAGIFLWWRTVLSASDPGLRQRLEEKIAEVAESANPFLEYPLAIQHMRKQLYPGSELTIEQEVANRNGYREYIASYLSEGNKIYGLLTIPTGTSPQNGWPIIIFNHGYIPPELYRTTERYEAYQADLASAGYITFKPDYRGHGDSEGEPLGAYYSPAYTVDVLNALSSVQKLAEADATTVGMWGHSLGGNITLRSAVINDEIDAVVIWSGVVSSYEEIFDAWSNRPTGWQPSAREQAARNASVSGRILLDQIAPEPMRELFWQAVDPVYFLQNIQAPIQLHHGQADPTVDWRLSQSMAKRLEAAQKSVELHLYPGSDHDISQSYRPAMNRTLDFFDRHLKAQ